MKIMQSHTNPHIITRLYDILSSTKTNLLNNVLVALSHTINDWQFILKVVPMVHVLLKG